MPIEPGKSLLHYRIVEKLGEGGMGVVWKAVDTTLDREVAVKVLPEAFAGLADRLARFEREAKVLAALNHPNIAAIYGLHEAEGTRFLVMELVPGEELADRIGRGPVPTDEALTIALGIAGALEAAHEAGVVHRDLKPANVKVTPGGKVKVLDFGLAKALASDAGTGQVDASLSPTLTSAGTVAGVILGTAAYMSPEQARGLPADARADVWALGVVLFEMLTGRRMFTGKTVSDVLASVLKSDPDWAVLPSGMPPEVRRLLRRCLAREPELRLHHAADARLEIQDALAGGSPEEAAIATKGGAGASRGGILAWSAAAAGVILAALSLWLGGALSPGEPRAVLNLAVPFPAGTRMVDEQLGLIAVSPTGSHVAMVLMQDGVRRIWLRALDRPGITPLEGTENAVTPFFSPDGRWVGFFADGRLSKVSVEGGTPLIICDASGGNRGASWGDGDVIVFSDSNMSPLVKVPASGGTPVALTTLDAAARERTHRWPQVMPGGDVVLYTVGYLDSSENYEASPIDAVRISTGERKRVLEGASFARYAASGHLIFARGGFLFAVPFDPDALETRGTPVPVMENVMGNRNSGIVHMDVTDGGLLAFIPGRQSSVRRILQWVYPDGTRTRLAAPPDAYSNPALSPDGRRLAFSIMGEQRQDIWIHDIERETTTRLTFQGNNLGPRWSPDGRWVAFASDRDGRLAIFRKASDGSGEDEVLLKDDERGYFPSGWSPDGRVMAVVAEGEGSGDLWILSLEDGAIKEFVRTSAEEIAASFSPDGRWIVYQSDESGQDEVYVRPFPGPGGRWQISARGGVEPQWSADGSRIYYLSDERIWAVDVEAVAGGLTAGRPRVIAEKIERTVTDENYVIDGNGARFLLISRDDEGASDTDRVTVVVNWFDDLRSRF